MSLTHFRLVFLHYISDFLMPRTIELLHHATIDGWELKFSWEKLRKTKGGWIFIFCKSCMTLPFSKLFTFWWCISFFSLGIIYITIVENFSYDFVKIFFNNFNYIYLATLKIHRKLLKLISTNIYSSCRNKSKIT